ncbi:hypothetical protein [Streptomyces sp. NPDC047869]|uniref:hypothetical protein n=1 Tax=Streptomyces sp. NPDC047869 TaxID=3154709 RepID=UPI003454BFAE
MNCVHRGKLLPEGSRRDRAYCDNKCRGLASYYRRKAGVPPPPRWQHPALTSDNLALRSASAHAEQLGEANGWSPSLVRCAMDGLTAVLEHRPPGKPVKLTEIRTRMPRHASSFRVAEVLADLDLLEDDSASSIRSWIDDRTGELPDGFAGAVYAWLLVLLDGDRRAKPRSRTCLYVYFGCVRPLLENWATTRFAKKRGLIFANPTTRLRAEDIPRSLLPMTDDEVLAVQRIAVTPAQRLIVALAAVHAARATAIRHLSLDDLDLPNRRITIAGHGQRLGELPHQTLLAWLDQRRATWPKTPNRHVLINAKTALGAGPVSPEHLKRHLLHQGVYLERVRGDRVLHEALTAGADPLHLALVFNLSHSAASRYAAIAQNLLDDQIEQTAEVRPKGRAGGLDSCP